MSVCKNMPEKNKKNLDKKKLLL